MRDDYEIKNNAYSSPVFRNETPKLRFCNFDEQLLIA